MARTNDSVIKLTVIPELEPGSLTKQLTTATAVGIASGMKQADIDPLIQKLEKTGKAFQKATIEAAVAANEVATKGLKGQALLMAQMREKDAKQAVETAKKEHESQLKFLRIRAKARKKLGWGKGPQGLYEKIGAAGTGTEKFGEGLADAFGKATSKDIGQMAGLFKSLMASPGKIGTMMEANAGASGLGKIMGEMGGFLTKIGPAIAAIGAVAAGLAAVAKILIEADNAAAEFNQALIEAGGAAIDLQTSTRGVGDTLDYLQGVFARLSTGGFSFLQDWNIQSKDVLQVMGQFSEAGYTLKEITRGIHDETEETLRLQTVTSVALTYSKLLGESTSKITEQMSDGMEEFGWTLEGVRERFSTLVAAAKESGFGTKRFFSMVLQATSGMSMYNVRLEEAASLLGVLGKALGQKEAGQTLQTLMKSYQGMSTQERLKKSVVGGGNYDKIAQLGAKYATRQFFQQISEQGPEAAAKLWGVLGEFGVKQTDKLGDQIKRISTLSPAEIGQIRVRFGHLLSGEAGDALGRGLANLVQKTGPTAAAMQAAGPTEAILYKLYEAQGVLGMRLDQIRPSDIIRQLAEEGITGISAEDVRKLQAFGQYIQAIQADFAGALKKGAAGITEFNDRYAKSYGIMIGTDKKFHKAVREPGEEGAITEGEAVDNDFITLAFAMSDRMPRADQAQISEDLQVAKEIAAKTAKFTDILDRGVVGALLELVELVRQIRNWVFGDERPPMSAAQQRVQAKTVTALETEIERRERELEGKKSALELAPESERKAKEDEVARLSDELERKKLILVAAKSESQQLPGDVKTPEQFEKAVLGTMPEWKRIRLATGITTSLSPVAAPPSYTSYRPPVGGFSPEAQRIMGIQPTAEEEAAVAAQRAAMTHAPRPLLPVEPGTAHDFLMQNSRLQRIDSADVTTGVKAGGPISRAVGGGGEVHNYHFYNDGPGNYRTLVNARKAGALRR